MRNARVWLAAALVALVVPATAQAAVPEYRAGEQSDPTGDGPLAYGDSGGGPARLLDVKKVQANYDAGTGALNLAFEGVSLGNLTHSGVTFRARISAPSAGDRCDAGLRDGDFEITASGSSGYDRAESAYLINAAGTTVAVGGIAWENGLPLISITAPSLLRRDYRCVSNVSAVRLMSGFNGETRDAVADFCLAGCPPDTGGGGPGPVYPAAPANFRAAGNTLNWGGVSATSSFVVATSNLPEGAPGRATTYRTVTGTSFTPPAAPGATRSYGVRANLANSRWTTPEVGIAYPRLVDPPTGGQGGGTQVDPPKPLDPKPGQSQTPDVNRGIVVTNANTQNQTTTVVSLVLSVSKARSAAREALVARYGKAFSRRAKRGYKLACTPAGSNASCAVQWRYKRSRYKGKVDITRTQEGDLWHTVIKRSSLRR